VLDDDLLNALGDVAHARTLTPLGPV